MSDVTRRSFMKAALAASAFPYVGCLSSKSPDGKVRMACIGIGCQPWNDMKEFEKTGFNPIKGEETTAIRRELFADYDLQKHVNPLDIIEKGL